MYKVLTREPSNDSASYPRTRPYSTGSFRQFQPSWLVQFPWLHYSPFCDGAYCRACAFFAPERVGGNIPGQFVTTPFKSWVSKTQKMSSHGRLDYHMTACSKMREFLSTYETPSAAVHTRLDSQLQEQQKKNLAVIESLLKVVLLLGKQGLAFRGHRDDKVEWDEFYEETGNLGNFLEVLQFRAETDQVLRDHLQHAPRNAQYTSKTIQNQLISVIGDHIRSEIVSEIKKAKFYSIMADEVTDISNKEQLSVSFRYLQGDSVKEVFLDFIEVERITGRVLADAILKSLGTWDLPVKNMRGQCYDGASNMAGARSGCNAIIQEVAPQAIYHHCAAHRLNLAIVSACKISAFRNTESYIGEMSRFFQVSEKRQRLLDKAIDLACPKAHAKKLKDSCKTRWVEHIDSYTVFLELLPAVHTTLQAMLSPSDFEDLGTDWNWDAETLMKANGFIHQLESSAFLVCFKILLECLTHLRGLTLKLQMQAVDVLYAYSQVDSAVSSLKRMRENATSTFHTIFVEATKLGKDLHGDDFELKQPRTTHRQVHRDNVPASSPEEYFRITLFNEFVSHIVAELEARFASRSHSSGLLQLMPNKCKSLEESIDLPETLAKAADYYHSDLPHRVMLASEFRSWVGRWKKPGCSIPEKLVDTLRACDSLSYPNIRVLLELALTLPITSCECERSFSQLKLIKTSHRSTTTASRLSGLALMKINREKCSKLSNSSSELKKLVLSFSKMHPRRMKLPFILED